MVAQLQLSIFIKVKRFGSSLVPFGLYSSSRGFVGLSRTLYINYNLNRVLSIQQQPERPKQKARELEGVVTD